MTEAPAVSSYERVPFRLIVCPECTYQMCWVNPRLPTYCPECGKYIFPKVRSSVRVYDEHAGLRYKVKGNEQ